MKLKENVAKLKMDLQESDNNQMSDANMVESHNNNNGVVVDDLRTGGHLGVEPPDGIDFDTHEAAYTFYQDYAKSMGFTTSIKNSRRSKKTKDFIDAKFACSRYAIELSEEGCVSEENYNIVLRTLVETLKNCVDLNHARNNFADSNSQLNNGAHEEENHVLAAVKATKKKTVVRKRKGQPEAGQMLESQPSLQPMENISSEGMSISGYYGPQQNVQGLLNLMEPPHEGYYVNQRTIQGLGQLNSIAPVQDSFFTNQQAMPGLGQMDFRPPPNFAYNLQDEHLRSAQLPGNSSRQL
ncbi:hypothetical protein HID58_093795 [Brassica napus]|uniref:FAR1 domain-containing protein n=1 Tax=Brassica napus TaxID=3708 RepID=A0ABQ7XCB0_BRANA|nr:hypothetical protein HID58_093795 [Brassica napus]